MEQVSFAATKALVERVNNLETELKNRRSQIDLLKATLAEIKSQKREMEYFVRKLDEVYAKKE